MFPGRAWTQAHADERLARDAARFAAGTRLLCPEIDGDVLAGISDFSYNLGLERLKTSTLRRKVNGGVWEDARRELRKWVNGGGRRLPGLVLRREAEAALLPA